jgi:hypothetical protein
LTRPGLRVIRVDGKGYPVGGAHGSSVHVRLADGSTRRCKRIYRPGTQQVETHLDMQTRVQELMIELTARQERVELLSARSILGSPALASCGVRDNPELYDPTSYGARC